MYLFRTIFILLLFMQSSISASPVYLFSNSCIAPVVSCSAIDIVGTTLSTCELALLLREDRQTLWIIQPTPWRDFVAVSDFVHRSSCADLEAGCSVELHRPLLWLRYLHLHCANNYAIGNTTIIQSDT